MSKSKTSKSSTISAAERLTAFRQYFNGDAIRFVIGLAVLGIAVFMIISFTAHLIVGEADQSLLEHARQGEIVDINSRIQNYGGTLGAHLSYYFMNKHFGIASCFIPLFLFFLGMKLTRAYKIRLWKWFVNFSFLMVWSSLALATIELKGFLNIFSFPIGGEHGNYMARLFSKLIGEVGLIVLLLVAAITYLVYLSQETIIVIRRLLNPKTYLQEKFEKIKPVLIDSDEADDETDKVSEIEPTQGENVSKPSLSDETPQVVDFSAEYAEEDTPLFVTDNEEEPTLSADPKTAFEIEKTEEAPEASSAIVAQEFAPYDPKLDLENYRHPTLDLLHKYEDNTPSIDMAEQTENKERIINTLRNYDVEISSIKATIGPTITLYEITPAKGVRISKIRNLEDDIALSLRALGIRIIAPIPGKGTIGIEVPNTNPKMVSIESILNSRKFQECDYDLPIALGKTITNEVFMVDLAKMPHLLVAGATGQGKSVGLNAIITSLLYKKHPAELKFVMVDPKKVEFSVYGPLEKHFLAKVPDDNSDAIITDVTKVIQTLKSLCQEMDDRYDLLKKAKVRNVKEYNEKFKSRLLNPEAGHRFMPYIVVIIDEFGDLIMTAGKEVELPIARIAQLARAVGMHMVIATQRPTTNIITGTIKANFPARIAFKVMSQIDSRTILDRPGANQLIGKGDMLFLSGGDPTRVQCAFVDTPEVERINSHIARQQSYLAAYELPEAAVEGDGMSANAENVDINNLDPLFEECARLVVIHQHGSTSLLQRKFSIGYNKAGRIMDQLERMGIVGPAQGSKPRDVLCADEIELERKLTAF